MKLLIAVDMEGISGVVNWSQVTPGHAEYERFRHIMTADVNAAVAGAAQAGAEEIIVADGHWDGCNVLIEELDPRARLHSGNAAPLAMTQGIETGVDAVIFIGYHARVGSEAANLDHTWSSVGVANLWLNDRIMGETELNSSLCGHFGAPVLMISGDQTVCAQAAEWIPGIETAVVKRATSRYSAECLQPQVSQKLITETVASAVTKFLAGKGPAPIKVEVPVKVAIEFNTSAQADGAALFPGAKRLHGRKVEVQFEDMLTAFKAFRSLVNLGDR